MTTIAAIPLSALRATASRDPACADARWRIADIEALFALPLIDLPLRTTSNAQAERDRALFERLGLNSR
jgi:hypothetical protein